jgi:hypothetical protein
LFVEATLVGVAYAGVTFGLLYPLFAAPGSTLFDPAILGRLSLFSLGDMYTVIWVMSWGWHALTTDPLGLFDANIFHPAENVLTSTEHMLGHLPIFGVVYGAGGNPILANQVNLFAALTLCGVSMYALLRHWGVGRAAAFAGGAVFAYFPLRLTFITHVHLIAGQYLVLAIIALDRALQTGGRRWLVAFAVLLGLQCLCSFYLAYMSLVALVGYGAAILLTRRWRPATGRLLRVAVAGGLALVPFLLLALPYLQVRESGTLPVEQEQALLRYLSVKLQRLFLVREEGYYAGLSVALIAACGLLPRVAGSSPVPWARGGALAIALTCVVFAMGPALEIGGRELALPYQWAAWGIPGFSAMRGPIRFILIAMVGVAALAGFGFDRLLRIGPVAGTLVAVAATGLVAWDYMWFERVFPVRPVAVGDAVPAVYRALAALPRGPVLEIPSGGTGEPVEQARESDYTFHSIYHWQPLLNGRSGYAPSSYTAVMALARALPDARALALLRRSTGLRYVVVHFKQMRLAEWLGWNRVPGLRRVRRYDDAMLFEVIGEQPADLRAALLDPAPSSTVTGAPLQLIGEGERRAEVRIAQASGHMASRMLQAVRIEVRNPTETAWPIFTPIESRRVGVGYRWIDETGAVVSESADAAWLPYDLLPGESIRVAVTIRASVPPGPYRLRLGVTQSGAWFAGPTDEVAVEVMATAPPGGVDLEDSPAERLR